jgi:1-acyl-sn-glycerol-3-phosphate acyltransferase
MPSNTSEPTSKTSQSGKIVPVASRVSPWLASLAYPLGRYVLLPFYFNQITVTGQENLPTQGPVIIAPTHRSRWDAFTVSYAAGQDITGRDLRFMVSANEMTGIQGWFIRRFGGFPIDPQQPGISSLRHGVELLCERETLVIFPEGNIYRDAQLHPLKAGLGRLAMQAESLQPALNINIVPMSIQYSQAVPHWGCDVNIRIGSPLQTSNYDITKPKTSAKQLMADLATALIDLDKAQPSFTNSQIVDKSQLSAVQSSEHRTGKSLIPES